MANGTGEHFTDAHLHPLRGETLLHGDPTNASPAEVAFLTAIAIARRQDARSYELISSLSLARLYQSTGRAEQALSLLTPALKGFSPTLEMPQIAEAQTLADQCRRDVRSDN